MSDSIQVHFSQLNVSQKFVSVDLYGNELAAIFEKNQELPGVLVYKGSGFVGMIPRNRFYEHLGRPFATEIFLHRPIRELLDFMGLARLIIPAETSINEAVRIAFSRPEGQRYDPITVQLHEDLYIVDMHNLLLTLSSIYEKLHDVISKQMEIGKALSSSIDTPHLLSLILQRIGEMIPSHASAIFLDEEYGKPTDTYASIIDAATTKVIFKAVREFTRQNLKDKNTPYIFSLDDRQACLCLNSQIPLLSILYFPLFYGRKMLGFLYVLRFHLDLLDDKELLSTSSAEALPAFSELDIHNMMGLESIISTSIHNSHLLTYIRHLANTDTLTNIYNRRGFFSEAHHEIQNAQKKKRALCALIIDIDHFKNINDSFGHASGDEVIRAIVQETCKNLRDTDLIGRYGGEEFVILLPDSEFKAAAIVGNRIRESIAALRVKTVTGVITVTVSIGIAQFDSSSGNLDTLLMQADQALNIAKLNGRNQIVTWDKKMSWHNYNFQTHLRKDLNGDTKLMRNASPLSEDEIHSLEDAIDDLINGYVHALELRDKETEGHAKRVTNVTVPLSERMGFKEDDLIRIRRGCLLHDIGKIAIPDDILLKNGPLTEMERAIMQRHPRYAYDLLSTNIFLKDYLEIPYCHHEHWDGSGYPRRLKGEQIPLSSRIFTLVDVWDALLSDRPYRKAWKEDDVYKYIDAQSGILFDPRVVEEFFGFLPLLIEIT